MKQLLLIAFLLGQVQNQTGTVTGRLTKDGKPASGIRVTAMAIPEAGVRVADMAAFAGMVQTDSDGRYRLENIPPGKYYVTAGFLDIPTYYPGVVGITEAKAVSVEAGTTSSGIDFTTSAPSGMTVSGRVVFPPGQILFANRQASLAGLQTTLQDDGTFEFLRVRPGTHSLRIPGAGAAANTTIVAADADITGLEIVVPYNLTGEILVEDDGPLPKVSLSFGPGLPPVALTRDGTFTSALPPGEYRLAVSGLPRGYSVKAMAAGSDNILANPFKVSTAPLPYVVVTLAVASPSPWVKVSGKVGGPGLAPSSMPYRLALSGATLFNPIEFGLAPDGSFELSQVLPGEYTLGLSDPTLPVPPLALKVENKDLRDIQFQVPVTKAVGGRIMVEGDGPTPQAFRVGTAGNTTVSYVIQGGVATAGTTFVANSAGALTFTFTDAAGTAKSEATGQVAGLFQVILPQGARRVAVEVPGYTVKSLAYGDRDLLENPLINVSADETAQFEILLVRSATSLLVNTINVQAGALPVLNSVLVSNSSVGAPAGRVVNYTILGSSLLARGPASALLPAAVYVGADVAKSNLLSSVRPLYRAEARAQDVLLRVSIDKEGRVTSVSVISGDPLLNDAAIEAVKQWRYRPQFINGQPSDVMTTVTVTP